MTIIVHFYSLWEYSYYLIIQIGFIDYFTPYFFFNIQIGK